MNPIAVFVAGAAAGMLVAIIVGSLRVNRDTEQAEAAAAFELAAVELLEVLDEDEMLRHGMLDAFNRALELERAHHRLREVFAR